MAIVITGATGHLGLNVVRELIERGKAVIALHRSSSPPEAIEALQNLGATLLELDLETEDLTNRKTFHKVSVEGIVHCAALFSYDLAKEPSLIGTNMRLTRQVVHLAQLTGAPKLVATSSVAAVGLSSTSLTPLRSDDWYQSSVPYLRSKHDSERLLFELCKEANISLTTLCPTHIIGPNFFKLTPSLQVLADICHNRFPFSPPLSMNFLDVRDAAKAHVQALSVMHTGRYLIGSQKPISFYQTVKLMNQISHSVRVPAFQFPKIPLKVILKGSLIAAKQLQRLPIPKTFGRPLARAQASLSQLNEFFSGEIWLNTNPALTDLNFRPRDLLESLGDTMTYIQPRSKP